MRIIIILAVLLWSGIANAQDDAPSKTEDRLYHISQGAVIAGWAWDNWTTAVAINNPIRHSYQYCEDGSQTCQFPVLVEQTVFFREVGVSSWFGAQEPSSIAAVGLALDAGILVASHLLYKRGGIWRKVVIGINFVQAGNHMIAGLGNVSKVKSAKIGLVPAGAFSIRW